VGDLAVHSFLSNSIFWKISFMDKQMAEGFIGDFLPVMQQAVSKHLSGLFTLVQVW